MNRDWRLTMTAAAFALAISLTGVPALAADDNESQAPSIESIGEQRYRIGEIIVDKAAARFTVPGKIVHVSGPLEYLAVAADGLKTYESLTELSASPTEFNLACILIGLDEKNSVKPRYQFDERKAEGQAVFVTISWQENGATVTISGANALTIGENDFNDDGWVYIGSTTSEDGQQFLADMTGTLIGFVHDPYSVIDHGNGAAMGEYGLLTANKDALPPEGSAVTLTVGLVAE